MFQNIYILIKTYKDKDLKNMSIITMKIPYTLEDKSQKELLLKYIKNYNSIYNQVFNFHLNNLKNGYNTKTKDVLKFFKTKNNILLDTWFQQSAFYNAKEILTRLKNEKCLDKKIIFGGKRLFLERCKNKITKEEFRLKRLLPIYSVGCAFKRSNLKFRFLDKDKILFKPYNSIDLIKINLKVYGKQYKKYIKKLIELQEQKRIPITYSLDLEYIYISFEHTAIKTPKKTRKIKNRIFAIDMNPNEIGYSIIDWKSSSEFKLIKSGSISIKDLLNKERDNNATTGSKTVKYFTNKRQFETIEMAHYLIKLANSYKCKVFAIENLNIKSENTGKGRKLNRLINNQWNRNKLLKTIYKQCDYFGIYYQEILPEYSSFIGNILYRKLNLPDYCLASIEISRRAYEFYNQYITKEKSKNKNIVFLEKEKVDDLISQSLEELGVSETFSDLKDLYYKLKPRKSTYRVQVHDNMVLREIFNRKALTRHRSFFIKSRKFKIF